MGRTTTPLGCISGGPKTMLKSGPTVSWTAHESLPARSHKSIIPDLLRVSDRRLRKTKSHTLPRKGRKTITDSLSRSYSVTTNFSAEKVITTPDSPGDSSKRDWKLVCQCMRCKVHSARRCSRWRMLQTNFWSPLPLRGCMVCSRVFGSALRY